MNPEDITTPNTPTKPNGVMIGSFIIILLLIIGGVYLFLRNQEAQAPVVEVEEYDASEELSNSDELESIETDLEENFEINIEEENLE